MCGIAGLVRVGKTGYAGALEPVAAAMAATLVHRGPDDCGTWADEARGVALGHRRLAIIDLSPAGHQPMLSCDGRMVLVLNGEIYNYRELRGELERAGYPFRGGSDTEVALAAFATWGVRRGLERLVGMFALALWDQADACLWLARDRFGEKPLYYGCLEGRLCFASELKALRPALACMPDVDRQALGDLVRLAYIPAPRTIYRGICKLPPGSLLRVDPAAGGAQLCPEPFWSLEDRIASCLDERRDLDPEEAVDTLDGLLRQVIRRQMVADVPLGAFLSGGLDSSTVVALMQAQSTRRVRTFSIGFREPEYDEAQEARRVAAHLGTDHTELYVTPGEAMAVIPGIPAVYDEPFADSSQIPTFLLCALTRRAVTVALTGDGGDELFGGYARYLVTRRRWAEAARRRRNAGALAISALGLAPPALLDRAGAVMGHLLGRRGRWSALGRRVHARRAAQGAAHPLCVYADAIALWRDPAEIVRGWQREGLYDRLQPTLDRLPGLDEQMMYVDTKLYLPDDILVKVDRASMAHSLECRVPFLDPEVFELAWRLPADMRIRGATGKWLLRQVLHRYVPPALVDRPKMGFGVPIDHWLRGPLRAWAEALLDEGRMRREGYFEPGPIRQRWRAHLEGEGWHYVLWPVLMFQAWLEAQRL